MLPYNKNSRDSILSHAKVLVGKSLKELYEDKISSEDTKNKGRFGHLLETHHFKYSPNSNPEPDFPEAKLELKSCPLKSKEKGTYKTKERLVLNIINYNELENEEFETSSFWKKNSGLLLVFYMHSKDKHCAEYKIEIVGLWDFPEVDLEIIKQDWKKIQEKIRCGKAHELSEGDTIYLGACTKGASSDTVRTQPNSEIQAKQRAFSLKQGYTKHIANVLAKKDVQESILDTIEVKTKGFEASIIERLQSQIGKPIEPLVSHLNLPEDIRKKSSYLRKITCRILGSKNGHIPPEFEKGDIDLRCIRVNQKGKLHNSVSLRTFRFTSLLESNWEESSLREELEKKFLFVFFKGEGNNTIIDKFLFWNMPPEALMKAKDVYEHTQEIIRCGEIVRKIKDNGERLTNFVSLSENMFIHVRPHGRNARDCYPLPIRDQLTQALEYTKQSFWINEDYIEDIYKNTTIGIENLKA